MIIFDLHNNIFKGRKLDLRRELYIVISAINLCIAFAKLIFVLVEVTFTHKVHGLNKLYEIIHKIFIS